MGAAGSESSIDEPLDRWLLLRMHASAALVVLVFGGTCAAAASAMLRMLQALVASQPGMQLALLMAAIAAEAVFAMTWARKYRRLNAQPAWHAPQSADFDAMHTLRKFIEEQGTTSKWICIKDMLSVWFQCPVEDIHLDNVAELVTYGFFYMSTQEYEQRYGHDPRLVVQQLSTAWGVQFKPGYNPRISFMAHLWQPIRCSYRPLLFYVGIELLFALKHCVMRAMGFSSGTCQGFTYYTYQQPQKAVQRTHSSGSQRDVPVLFQHGVGLGLLPYAHFVARIAATGHPVVAVECSHLGMRWVRDVPHAETVVSAIAEVLQDRLGWQGVCASGHSYGTFYCSRLAQLHPQLVGSMGLIDPVTFNMFTGKLIKNFVYEPGASSLVTWLIARDIHHAASVCRNFFWSQLNLWPERLPSRTLVVLSDCDDLVPIKETVAMLKTAAPHTLVMHHPTHKHAHFIADIPWQNLVVTSLVHMLNATSSPSPSLDPPGTKAGPACMQQGHERAADLHAPALAHANGRAGADGDRRDGESPESSPVKAAGRRRGRQAEADQQLQAAEVGVPTTAERWHAGRLRARRRSSSHLQAGDCAAGSPTRVPAKAVAATGLDAEQAQTPGRQHQHSDSASSYENVRLRAKPHRGSPGAL